MTPRDQSQAETPTRAEVTARVRRCAELSRDAPWPALVDLSASAVAQRLTECARISKLAVALSAAGRAAGVSE